MMYEVVCLDNFIYGSSSEMAYYPKYSLLERLAIYLLTGDGWGDNFFYYFWK